jgi:hypothetical protein
MKKVIFICSHLFSGSNQLYAAMQQNPRIQGYKSKNLNNYESSMNIINLMSCRHKANNNSAIFMDEINFNYQISTKNVYSSCKFIYVLRSPEQCIPQIISNFGYRPLNAVRYYTFRLRRICEMARNTPGAVLLTFDDLLNDRGADLINDYLELVKPIDFNPNNFAVYKNTVSDDLLGSVLRSQACDKYERYLYFLKNQSLRRPL